MLRELNEKSLMIEEVSETVNEMKAGKAPGLDVFFSREYEEAL